MGATSNQSNRVPRTLKRHRRRKRSSTSSHEDEAAPPPSSPSWFSTAILAVFVLCLANVFFSFDFEGPTAPGAAVRRALLGAGETYVAEEENVWRRQLRERKEQRRKMDRSMAAEQTFTEGGGVDAYDWGRTRSMKVVMELNETWPPYEGKHRFEECVDKTIAQCQTLIDVYVSANREQFNNRTTLYLDLRKVREITDESYYKVVIRTDMDARFVAGIFNNGRVYYPWPWTVFGEDLNIGPWDCAGLTPAQCCQNIQEDVPDPNDPGDFLACFVEEPVGTNNNPESLDRAITVVSPEGTVLRAPIAH